MKTTHEIKIFKKGDIYNVFLDGGAILENEPMTKNHIRAFFFIDDTEHIKQAVESLKGILGELTDAKRTLIKKEINKLERLIK